MITKEQAQAHKSAFQQSNAKTPAFVQTVSASVCMDYLNTIIALHERVERLTEALEFYADPSNYRMNGPLDPNSGFFTGGPAETILREATND